MVGIGDAGMPIPSTTRRIDLALTKNVPGFIETVRAILSEMQVERFIVAEETGKISPHIQAALQELMPATRMEVVSHSQVKVLSGQARAMIRTGEFTPYANVILVAGVVF